MHTPQTALQLCAVAEYTFRKYHWDDCAETFEMSYDITFYAYTLSINSYKMLLFTKWFFTKNIHYYLQVPQKHHRLLYVKEELSREQRYRTWYACNVPARSQARRRNITRKATERPRIALLYKRIRALPLINQQVYFRLEKWKFPDRLDELFWIRCALLRKSDLTAHYEESNNATQKEKKVFFMFAGTYRRKRIQRCWAICT